MLLCGTDLALAGKNVAASDVAWWVVTGSKSRTFSNYFGGKKKVNWGQDLHRDCSYWWIGKWGLGRGPWGGGGVRGFFFEFKCWEVSGVDKRKWAVSRAQEEGCLQRKRTICIASWTKRRRLREKRKERREAEEIRGVQMLRGDRVMQQQRILENDYDYNFQHQEYRVGAPWEFFLSHCYFGGYGDGFSSLVGSVDGLLCCFDEFWETEPRLSIEEYCSLCEYFLPVMIWYYHWFILKE